MKVLLIYDAGNRWHVDVTTCEFDSKEKMIEFVNSKGIGGDIINCYEIGGKIQIEPFQIGTEYRITD